MSSQPDLADPGLRPVLSRPGEPPLTFGMRLRLWRNRQIASPAFRRWMARLPFTRWVANRKANQLFQLTAGFVYTQILTSSVRVGVFDALRDRWLSTDELATHCGLPADRMRLLLQQAARLNLVIATPPDGWMLDDAGAVLASDRGLTQMILHHDMLYRDLAEIDSLLAAPKTETRLRRYWGYVRETDGIASDDVAAYSSLMRDSQAMMADCILDAHDFSRYRCLLDVGGGDGAFLAAAAARSPDLKLQLFDLPPVAERAKTHLANLGLGPRSDVHGGDFVREPVPSDADCVTLIRILCDHDDARVRLILANLHRSLAPGTKLVIAEAMAGASEGARLAASYFSIYFLAMGSGRCRSDSEICSFLAEAGFRNAKKLSTANPLITGLVIAER